MVLVANGDEAVFRVLLVHSGQSLPNSRRGISVLTGQWHIASSVHRYVESKTATHV